MTRDEALALARAGRDPVLLARQALGPAGYAAYLAALDVAPFRERAEAARREHLLRCGWANGDGRAWRYAVRLLPPPPPDAGYHAEQRRRWDETALALRAEDALRRQSRECYLARAAEARADEAAHKLAVLLPLLGGRR